MDYKNTINLPQTGFAMKANLAQREPQMLADWENQDWYALIQAHSQGRPLFILHDGPPYANGDIHIGHAVNKILKDIIVKAKLLAGFQAPYIPGWDCHGLPIELQVEKKVGKVGRKVDANTFRQKCREYASRQIDRQRDGFKRLGVLGDWDHPYQTKDFSYEADMLRALAGIVENGHLQQGVKPVHWCFSCGSALAEAEIEYQDKQSPAIDVLFSAAEPEILLQPFELAPADAELVGIPIWTTTPWTLPANQAVALHADLEYVLLRCRQGQRRLALVVAGQLVNDLVERYGLDDVAVSRPVAGKQFEHMRLQHPFYEREVPVVLGDHVTTEAGTGAVHTAPGHGQEDFQVGLTYDLPVTNPVGPYGAYKDDTPLLGGQKIWAANDEIITLLERQGVLLKHVPFEHSYPHCWRHKTPTAFMVTPQWFISMQQAGLRQQALSAAEAVEWIPDWGEARIQGMLENRPDWCISRQRTWGVPITLFVDKDTHELHPDSVALMHKAADLVEQEGVDIWYSEDIFERLNVSSDDYVQVKDILDVWFDSGVSHHCVVDARSELRRPVDLYLEGSDQHRGWFQSSLLTSVAMHGAAPYRQVLTHGFTVDADGRKMSKSLGNVISPQQVMNRMGADVLRLWVASADYRQEITVSDEILKRVSDAYRRIRNTARFLLGNLYGFDQQHDVVEKAAMLPLDRWAVDKAWQVQQAVTAAYQQYEFLAIYQKVHHFCAMDMSAFYLDILKDRLYTMPEDSLARRSAQTAMQHILEAMVRWVAPVLSFTAQEMWQAMGGEREPFVLMSEWYEDLYCLDDPLAERSHWEQVIALREVVSKELETLRKDGRIGSSLAAEVVVYCDAEQAELLAFLGDELRFVLLTSEAALKSLDEAPDDALRVTVDEREMALEVVPSKAQKCVRCWHYRTEVGQHAEHPELCSRCVENVAGNGEIRRVA